jgi:hypothetical protein
VAIDAIRQKIKGYHSEVAGDAMPADSEIDAGNRFLKMNAKMSIPGRRQL